MPTWGTVLSPNQVDDLLALIDAWRQGSSVEAAYNATELITSAAFSAGQGDQESALLQVTRGIVVTTGAGQELLNLVHTAKVIRGEPHGKYTGARWSDAYVYNTMEAICLALAVDPAGDAELAEAQAALRAKVEEWIPIILAAQLPDGYIHPTGATVTR